MTKYSNLEKDVPLINMEQAATLAGFLLDTRKNTTVVDCPFCQGKKKFYISLSTSKRPLGIAHCMKCAQTLSPIGMYAYSLGISDIKEAAREWYKMNRSQTPEAKKERRKLQERPTIVVKRVDVDPVDLSVRNRTYHEMLKLLTLLPKHKENLLLRGMSEKDIVKGEYRSLPVSKENTELLVQALLQQGCVLKGVPGFYTDESNKWHLNVFGSGILIPQRNGLGQIQSFQIRRDTNEKSKRYISLSSRDKLTGSPAYAHCHLRIGRKGLTELILTEGPLKADVISSLTGYSVLAVPGVNSLSFLPQALFDLKKAGVMKIHIAYDMDIRTNETVQKAEKRLMSLLSRAQIPHTVLYWDERYKGLDDWAEANIRKNQN